MADSTRTYEQLALEEPSEKWELFEGRLRKKPPMTMEHYDMAFELAFAIRSQVDHRAFHVRCDQSRVAAGSSFVIPDVFVVPADLASRFRGGRDVLESYSDPSPFVAEVWSPTTGEYDVTGKLATYHSRGDEEIWLLHPFDHSLDAWRRSPEGAYSATRHTGGRLRLAALPDVEIDLDALFERA